MLVAVCAAVAGLSLHGAVGVRWLDRNRGDPRRYTAAAIVLALGSSVLAAALSALLAPRARYSTCRPPCARSPRWCPAQWLCRV